MNCDLFLWKLSRVHRTVPPLSTPAPEQSLASLGIHPSSTYVQWEAGSPTGSGPQASEHQGSTQA